MAPSGWTCKIKACGNRNPWQESIEDARCLACGNGYQVQQRPTRRSRSVRDADEEREADSDLSRVSARDKAGAGRFKRGFMKQMERELKQEVIEDDEEGTAC